MFRFSVYLFVKTCVESLKRRRELCACARPSALKVGAAPPVPLRETLVWRAHHTSCHVMSRDIIPRGVASKIVTSCGCWRCARTGTDQHAGCWCDGTSIWTSDSVNTVLLSVVYSRRLCHGWASSMTCSNPPGQAAGKEYLRREEANGGKVVCGRQSKSGKFLARSNPMSSGLSGAHHFRTRRS